MKKQIKQSHYFQQNYFHNAYFKTYGGIIWHDFIRLEHIEFLPTILPIMLNGSKYLGFNHRITTILIKPSKKFVYMSNSKTKRYDFFCIGIVFSMYVEKMKNNIISVYIKLNEHNKKPIYQLEQISNIIF